MAQYVTCTGCRALIDLYPPPSIAAQSGILWNQPVIVDTTVTIDGKRFCEKCGSSIVEEQGMVVPGYRIESGGVTFPSLELANKTFTVASGVSEVSIGELDDVANGGKSERVKLVTPVEDSKE